MTIDEESRARLRQRMEERRLHLGLRWRDLAAPGLSIETLRETRNGKRDVSVFTRRKIERALQWPIGEVDRILEDAEADQLRAAVSRPSRDEILRIKREEFAALMERIQSEEGLAAADAYFEEVKSIFAEEARKAPLGT